MTAGTCRRLRRQLNLGRIRRLLGRLTASVLDVRSHSLTYSRQSAMEDWLGVFQHQLAGGGDDGRDDQLMPSAMLEELEGLVRGADAGLDPPNRFHWKVLRDELASTQSALGSATLAATTKAWAALERALVAGGPPQDAAQAGPLRDAIADTRRALGDPAVRQAAWDDALEAHQDDADPESSEARIRVLADLCVVVGHDWKSLSDRLAQAINDNIIALVALGWPQPTDYAPTGMHDPAGLPMDQRLAVCRKGLASAAPYGPLVAWVGFDNAHLDAPYAQRGPLELWPGAAVPDGPTRGPGGERPAELSHPYCDMYFPDDLEHPWVLMRLELGDGFRAGAVQQARDLARTLVLLPDEQSGWQLMDGAAIFSSTWLGGKSIKPSRRREQFERDRRRDRVERDITAESLLNVDASFLGRVAQRHQVDRAAADLQWWDSLDVIPDTAQRTALAVRLLERRLPISEAANLSAKVRHMWSERASWWLRDTWAYQQLVFEMQDAVFETISQLEHPWHPAHARLAELRDRIIPSQPKGRYLLHLDRAARHMAELGDTLEPYEMAHRIVLATAAHLKDGPAASVRLAEYRRRFDLLLARANRMRNATLHGGEIAGPVADSVAPFAMWMAGVVVTEELEALRHEESLAESLQRLRRLRQQQLTRLNDGQQPIGVFWSRDSTAGGDGTGEP
jgi:hypothetical protein